MNDYYAIMIIGMFIGAFVWNLIQFICNQIKIKRERAESTEDAWKNDIRISIRLLEDNMYAADKRLNKLEDNMYVTNKRLNELEDKLGNEK